MVLIRLTMLQGMRPMVRHVDRSSVLLRQIFRGSKDVRKRTDPSDRQLFSAAQSSIMELPAVSQRTNILPHFHVLLGSIEKLERQVMKLSDALWIVKHVRKHQPALPREVDNSVAVKIQSVLPENGGFETIFAIHAVFEGADGVCCALASKVTPPPPSLSLS